MCDFGVWSRLSNVLLDDSITVQVTRTDLGLTQRSGSITLSATSAVQRAA